MPDSSGELLFGECGISEAARERCSSAVEELSRLTEEKAENVSTLEKLRQALGRAGLSLHALVQSHGTLQQLDFGYRKRGDDLSVPPEEPELVLRRCLDSETELIVTAPGEDTVYCAVRTADEKDVLMTEIPVGRRERMGDTLADMIGMFAVDRRKGEDTRHFPLREPHREEACQGYFRVVQAISADALQAVNHY